MKIHFSFISIEVIILIIFFSAKLNAQEILYYNLDLNIDVESKTISIRGFLDTDFKNKDTMNLLLWGNSSIKHISSNHTQIKYNFDTLTPSPIMYIPNGRPLAISKQPGSPNKQNIFFEYSCDMNNLNGWAKSFTKNWIELNFYSAWYPVNFDSWNYGSEFLIHISDGYSVTGSGIISSKNNHWKMIQPWGGDNIIIASNHLESRVLKENLTCIQIHYSGADFSESDSDSIFNECKYVLNMYEKLLGENDSTSLKFIIAPFEEGGGYSRKDFIRLGTKRFDLYTAKGIAHEIAHFWWHNASTASWEDWLNEAFAEYSMLVYLRDRKGPEVFQKQVEEYTSRIQNLPAVWGIERNAPDAYSVLYEKGALILCDLEEKVGKDAFFDFLKEAAESKVQTTESLLNLLEKKISKEARSWLENKLKNS